MTQRDIKDNLYVANPDIGAVTQVPGEYVYDVYMRDSWMAGWDDGAYGPQDLREIKLDLESACARMTDDYEVKITPRYLYFTVILHGFYDD